MSKINQDNNQKNDASFININSEDSKNIGMKEPDPSSHSNIAQIPDTDEMTTTISIEKQEKLSFLARLERQKMERELLDSELVSKESVEKNSRSDKYERFIEKYCCTRKTN